MTRKIRFSGFQDGETVTLSATKGSATRGPVTASAWNQGATGQDAVFQTTSTVLNANSTPIGVNMGGMKSMFNTLWDNRPVSHPSHEVSPHAVASVSQLSGTSYRVTSGEGSGFWEWDVFNASVFWPGGTAEFWRIENGTLSKIRTSEIIAADDFTIDIADDGGIAPLAGDMVIVRKTFPQPTSANISNRVVGLTSYAPRHRFAPLTDRRDNWDGNDPNAPAQWVEDTDGSWYGEYDIQTLSPSGPTWHRWRLATTAGTDNSFYNILKEGKTYRIEFTMRADAPRTVQVNYEKITPHTVTSINDTPASDTFPVSFNVTTNWQTFSLEFEVSSEYVPETPVQVCVIEPQTAGTYYARDLRMFDASAPFMEPTPDQAATISAANPHHIRDPRLALSNGEGKQFTFRSFIVDYLHTTMSCISSLGLSRAWLCIEFYLEPHAADLVEYLAGTADGNNPWADLRASLGRTAPWTDDIHILFEVGCEMWNNIFFNFPPMTDQGTQSNVNYERVYGKFCEHFITQMKTAASFNRSDYTFIVNGRFNNQFGDVAVREMSDADMVSRAGYVRGWEVGAAGATDSPQAFNETLFWPATITVDRMENSEEWLATAVANGAPAGITACIYEDGLSYSTLPPNIPDDEKAFARTKASATCWLDKISEQARQYKLKTVYKLDYGDAWHSHSNDKTKTWPWHQWTEIFNAHCKGELREVTVTKTPKRNVTVSGDFGEGKGPHSYTDVSEIGCYVFKDGTKWVAVLTNRNIPYDSIDSGDALYDASDDGSRTVQVSVDAGNYTLKKFTMSGAWNDQNFDDTQATYNASIDIVETNLGSNNGTISETIPAAEAVVYVWEA